ncbi:hypothetical protein FACS189440_15430 [Bacteroidia bacterium]|nr:hypothetical protein FACS189423_02290 [Bacteroidia bacterium]GHT49529.1 hypothetical protein FACS189440_15430 [Bacteroidia bacterium]
MGKREIFEETDYLKSLLDYYNKYRIFENAKESEKIVDSILDRILYLREVLKDFD